MKKNYLRNKRGITLVALVITIIVLLILAGITINLTIGQNGIMTTAQDAGKNYTQAYDDEQEQLETFYSDTDELVSVLANNEVVLHVGDYIDYIPDTAEGTKYEASKLETAITGYNNTTDLTADDLKWQILRIYKDGSMDLIGSVTSTPIYFKSAIGYNNGVYVMNDICKTLYSRQSDGVTARSVNIEDIEYWLQKDADGKTVKDKSICGDNKKVGDTQTYTGSYSKYPTLWARQKGANVNGTVKEEGISESDDGYTEVTIETYLPTSPTDSDSITVTQTFWSSGDRTSLNETNFGKGTSALYSSTTYWVATRYSNCYSNIASFGFQCASSSVTGHDLFSGPGYNDGDGYRLRPVVHLNSSIQIEKSSTASSKDGEPHHIVSY